MYIDEEKWENLKDIFSNLSLEQDSLSREGRYLLSKLNNLINNIDRTKSDKVYVITNNAVLDGEIDYQIKGVAFTKENANNLFEEAIKDAKIDADFDNLDVIDVSNDIEKPDGRWHYSKSDDNFKLYLAGEYSSNNFSIQILEYDLNKKKNYLKSNDEKEL